MVTARKWKIFWAAFGFGALAAAIDESIQLFVAGRHGCIEDVALDCSGVATGVLLMLLVFYIAKKVFFHSHQPTGKASA